MKHIFKYSIILILSFPLTQCQISQFSQIKRRINKSTSIKFINKEEFNSSRALMLSILEPDIVKNDTIIIGESFPDGTGSNYHSWIYESNENELKCYKAIVSYKKKVFIDSLVRCPCSESTILKMARTGRFDEIKRRGDATTLTPATTLIINIGVKNKEKKKFDFTTLVTQEFSALEDK